LPKFFSSSQYLKSHVLVQITAHGISVAYYKVLLSMCGKN
jgi:hypothetical protein